MSPTKRTSPPWYPATKSWKETANSRPPIQRLRSQAFPRGSVRLSVRLCAPDGDGWTHVLLLRGSHVPDPQRGDNAGSFAAAIRGAGNSGRPSARVWGSTTLVNRRVHRNREFLLGCVVRALLDL